MVLPIFFLNFISIKFPIFFGQGVDDLPIKRLNNFLNCIPINFLGQIFSVHELENFILNINQFHQLLLLKVPANFQDNVIYFIEGVLYPLTPHLRHFSVSFRENDGQESITDGWLVECVGFGASWAGLLQYQQLFLHFTARLLRPSLFLFLQSTFTPLVQGVRRLCAAGLGAHCN